MDDAQSEIFLEYDDDMITLLEAVWGRGFMSPGGIAEVDRILQALDLDGKVIADIGCGLGGMDVHIAATHAVERIIGIDIEDDLVQRCHALAGERGVVDRVGFRYVEPGPLPFGDGTLDMVISKDSIIHIPDKAALAADVYRVLKPDGWFAASDWLAGYDGEPSPQMQAYIEAEGLDFGIASARTYEDALRAAGFTNIEFTDRNAWYRAEARRERDNLAGALFEGLTTSINREFLEREVDVWDKMIVVLDRGELRPTHMRARKPAP